MIDKSNLVTKSLLRGPIFSAWQISNLFSFLVCNMFKSVWTRWVIYCTAINDDKIEWIIFLYGIGSKPNILKWEDRLLIATDAAQGTVQTISQSFFSIYIN